MLPSWFSPTSKWSNYDQVSYITPLPILWIGPSIRVMLFYYQGCEMALFITLSQFLLGSNPNKSHG